MMVILFMILKVVAYKREGKVLHLGEFGFILEDVLIWKRVYCQNGMEWNVMRVSSPVVSLPFSALSRGHLAPSGSTYRAAQIAKSFTFMRLQ